MSYSYSAPQNPRNDKFNLGGIIFVKYQVIPKSVSKAESTDMFILSFFKYPVMWHFKFYCLLMPES